MAEKKIVRLAVIRKDDDDPCPYGLAIPLACKSVGTLVDRMAPLEALELNATPEDKAKIVDANMKLWAWGLMQSAEEPMPCRYAGKLFEDERAAVECNHGDTASGMTEKGVLLGSPYYSQMFAGVGIEGVAAFPIGFYADYNTTRNLYFSSSSFAASNIDREYIKKLADKAYTEAIEAKTNILESATKNE